MNQFYHGLWQYMSVHGSTCGSTRQFYHGTRQYMAVHVSTGRFCCAFESSALPAPSVASASRHCRHKLVYLSLGRTARASPVTAPSLPPAAAAAAGDAAAGASPAAGGSVPSRSPAPLAPSPAGRAGGRRGRGDRGGGGGRRVDSRSGVEAALDDLGLGTSGGTLRMPS